MVNGNEAESIYFYYADMSQNLKAFVSGGSTNYNQLWSKGSAGRWSFEHIDTQDSRHTDLGFRCALNLSEP